MKDFFAENIFDFFNTGMATVTGCRGVSVRQPVTGVSVTRNDDLDLVIEIKSRGWAQKEKERFPAGTIRSSDDEIEFGQPGGWRGTAKGVTYWGYRSSFKQADTPDTVQTFTAHSIELTAPHRNCAYVIEWVQNLSDSFVLTDPAKEDVTERLVKQLGSGDHQITIEYEWTSGKGRNALHLNVNEVDIFVMPSPNPSDKGKLAGYIVYRGAPTQEFRDKVRTCLSFVLGKMIVYLGHTEYDKDWRTEFLRSVDALSIGGAVFKQADQPPYPIHTRTSINIIDKAQTNKAVNSLFASYEKLKFNELSWSYWYAVCAPLHAAAIHFGALIEQLQRNASQLTGPQQSKLVERDAWNELNSIIQKWINSSKLGDLERAILKNKASTLNQAPQSVTFQRLLDTMRLAVGDAENGAWQQRNRAAHGGISDNPGELILHSKLLRLLFHRMVAALTGCSALYFDYYSLNHPVRHISQAVPKRTVEASP